MEAIIVQMADNQWTEAALHLACAMARTTHSEIILLRMIETQHLSWLGTSLGVETFSPEESDRVWEYKAIAKRYGVEFSVEPMQWLSYVDAIVEASDLLNAEIVFASLPENRLSFMGKFQRWDLRRQLSQRHRTLYTLDQPVKTKLPAAPVAALNHQPS
ncbi:MAG: hypothetical protein ABI700_19295 [Chloroflexota bacterium]